MRTSRSIPFLSLLLGAALYLGAVVTGWLAVDGLLHGSVEFSASRSAPPMMASLERDPLTFWIFVSIYAAASVAFALLGTIQVARTLRQEQPDTSVRR